MVNRCPRPRVVANVRWYGMGEREDRLASDAGSLAAYIFATFVISQEEAKRWGNGLALWADGHADPGAPIEPFDLSHWVAVIHRRVGRTYEWRDQAKKQAWQMEEAKNVESYNKFLDLQRRSPFKKW